MASLRKKTRQLLTPAPAAPAREKATAAAGGSGAPGSAGKRGHAPQRSDAGAQPGGQHASDLGVLLGSRARALALFEQEGFNKEDFIAEYFQHLSATAVGNARQDLGALLARCNDEVEGVVYDHHAAFLEACRGVEDIEDQVALLRNYTNGLTALVANLKAQRPLGRQQAVFAAPRGPESSGAAEGGPNSRVAAIEGRLEVLLRELDVAVAARDLPSARALLAAGQDCLAILDRDAGILSLEVEELPSWRQQVEGALALRRRALAAGLERQLADAHASGHEIRSAAHALGQLLGGAHAVSAMLHCHSRKIAVHQAALLKQLAAGGSDPDNLEYAGAVMQRTLLEVAAAADGLVTIFGPQKGDVAAVFAVWANKEARGAAAALKRNALAAAAAAATGGLAPTARVAALAAVFCHELEATHSVSVSAAVSTELWPALEGALRRHVKRLGDELRMVAAEELDDLALQAVAGVIKRVAPDGPPQVTLVTPSTFAAELRSIAELMAPLEGPKVVGALRRSFKELYDGYIQAITSALKAHMDASPGSAARLQPLVAPVMEQVAALIEGGVPGALEPLARHGAPLLEPRELEARLQGLYAQLSEAARGTGRGGGGGGGVRDTYKRGADERASDGSGGGGGSGGDSRGPSGARDPGSGGGED